MSATRDLGNDGGFLGDRDKRAQELRETLACINQAGVAPMQWSEKAALRSYLEGLGLDSEIAEAWSKQARRKVRLVRAAVHDEDDTAIGASKLGGRPDRPDGMEWPMRPAYNKPNLFPEMWPDVQTDFDARRLDLLAQINLRDVASAGCDLDLPKSGTLLFFYDAEEMPTQEHSPYSPPGWRVIYVPEGEQLRRAAKVAGALSMVASVSMQMTFELPDLTWFTDRFGDREEEPRFRWYASDRSHGARVDLEMLKSWMADVIEVEDPRARRFDWNSAFVSGHAVGGWPAIGQNPMELDLEMQAQGLRLGRDPVPIGLRERSEQWRLLLQIDMDPGMEWEWHDAGTIYFWCREDDIAARRFENVVVAVQHG